MTKQRSQAAVTSRRC